MIVSSSEEESDNSSARGDASHDTPDLSSSKTSLNKNKSQSLHKIPNNNRSIAPSEISAQIPQINLTRKATIGENVSLSSSASVFRPISPSPSILSDKEKFNMVWDDGLDKGEDEHKRHLQIYVFVARCIAYPFNARQPTDMTRRYFKVNKNGLQQVKEIFLNFLNGDSNIAADEGFYKSIQHYYDVFLNSDRVIKMVTTSGCSTNDFREIYKIHIDKKLKQLPDKEGLNKEMILSQFMTKFDALFKGCVSSYSVSEDTKKGSFLQQTNSLTRSHQSYMHFPNTKPSAETALNKEQLYDMFQQILIIKKFEHQLLYNVLQLDNQDEQAAVIRRELDSRLQFIERCTKDRKLLPRFVLQKEMEGLFIDEVRKQINQLMINLESLPVTKVTTDSKYSLHKLKGYHHHHRSTASLSKIDFMDGNEGSLSKLDVVLTFNLEIVVMEVKGIANLNANRQIYCTMEIDGGSKLQTDLAEVSKPAWDSQGDFTTTHPLPLVKVKLYVKSVGMLALEDKELGKVLIKPTPFSSKMPEWYKLLPPSAKTSSTAVVKDTLTVNDASTLKIKIAVRMDKPQNMKHGGYLYAKGGKIWKKWRKRYFVLVQVSQYTFAMCSYREKKSDPKEMLQLDGFTIDYAQAPPGLVGGRYFFNAVKEGEIIVFASEEENDRNLWVQAFCRATGQSHRPIPPSPLLNDKENDRIRKHGMDELVQADPCNFDHNALFTHLQKLTLDYRLNEPIASLGWFSPGQIFVLEEYCSRYGVRGCMRHLGYLDNLITKAQLGVMIDPTLLHYSYAFCASHVHGNRPDGIGTVLHEEKEKFDLIKEKIRILLEHQITNFRYCFPFGRPEGALKSSLSLLERVFMKDIVTPASPEEVKNVIRKCLEKAALVNYTKISSFCHPTSTEPSHATVPVKKKVDSLINLAEMCIELLQQNEEYHAEAFSWFKDLMVEHEEIFWSLFAVDMDSTLESLSPDCWDAFPLFQLLNNYLCKSETLRNGKFHNHLQNIFAPMVVRYVDLMESSIAQSIHRGFERERWEMKGNGCATSEDMFWKLESLQTFIEQLNWPEEVFAKHLEQRLKLMSSDMIESCVTRTFRSFDQMLNRGKKTTDYVLPLEICTMINVVLDAKNKSMILCTIDGSDTHQYHTKIDEYLDKIQEDMQLMLIEKLKEVLYGVLQKLSRYDENSLMASILTLTKPTNELGIAYVSFMRNCLDQLRQKIIDDLYVLNIFENWYTAQMAVICDWLTERINISLHPYQYTCLMYIVRKCYSDFELQGVSEQILNSKTLTTIQARLKLEEAAISISSSSLATPNNPQIFDDNS